VPLVRAGHGGDRIIVNGMGAQLGRLDKKNTIWELSTRLKRKHYGERGRINWLLIQACEKGKKPRAFWSSACQKCGEEKHDRSHDELFCPSRPIPRGESE